MELAKDEDRLRKLRDEPNAWQTRKFLGTTVHTPEHKIVNVMRRRTCWTTQEIKRQGQAETWNNPANSKET
jgi:hypothetical protein